MIRSLGNILLFISDLGHFTDSSTGSLVTLDRLTGAVQWNVRIGSPIVALYLVQVNYVEIRIPRPSYE